MLVSMTKSIPLYTRPNRRVIEIHIPSRDERSIKPSVIWFRRIWWAAERRMWLVKRTRSKPPFVSDPYKLWPTRRDGIWVLYASYHPQKGCCISTANSNQIYAEQMKATIPDKTTGELMSPWLRAQTVLWLQTGRTELLAYSKERWKIVLGLHLVFIYVWIRSCWGTRKYAQKSSVHGQHRCRGDLVSYTCRVFPVLLYICLNMLARSARKSAYSLLTKETKFRRTSYTVVVLWTVNSRMCVADQR